MKHIVITGPESCGKTTLTRQLAAHLGMPWVPEYARAYLEETGGEYEAVDLVHMMRGQLHWEAIWSSDTRAYLLSDTGLLVYKIWSLYKYGKVALEIQEAYQRYEPDLWVLVDYHIPYEDDPFRENEGQREELFELYRRSLIQDKHNFVIARGTVEQRVQQTLIALDDLKSKA